MIRLIQKIKKISILLAFSGFLLQHAVAQVEHEGDWFSAKTLSAVVTLSSLIVTYDVEGLPDDYKYHTKGGKADFGEATIVSNSARLRHIGSGVVVTNDGLIISNAHVTRAASKPKISALSGDRVGPKGEPIKRVTVNPFPDVMFVGVADKNRIERGDDTQKLQYMAVVLEDDAHYDHYRDRAVLQIHSTAHLDEDGFPVIDERVKNLNLSCATFENPFKTSFVDRRVRAIGFPGTGDPNRSARTSGELMGYADNFTSQILHTSYISGGNSGGGLFHKDNLIGINTWDNKENESRPVAIAQPITYWFDMLIKTKWVFDESVSLPDNMILEWLSDDPGKESYKSEVQALFTLVSESNQNSPVSSGKLYAHRVDTDFADVITYLSIEKELNEASAIVYYLQYMSVDEIAKQGGFNKAYVEQFKTITNRKQLRDMLKPNLRPYFDEWYNETFYCKVVDLYDRDGKTSISVPKNSKIHLTYASKDLKTHTTFTLTSDDDYIQGPFKISVKQ